MNTSETELERKRKARWAEHYKPGMSLTEVFRLNEQIITLFPMTREEHEQRWEEMKDAPEFVL